MAVSNLAHMSIAGWLILGGALIAVPKGYSQERLSPLEEAIRDLEYIDQADGVLVPALQHQIKLFNQPTYPFEGVQKWRIGIDFKVG